MKGPGARAPGSVRTTGAAAQFTGEISTSTSKVKSEL